MISRKRGTFYDGFEPHLAEAGIGSISRKVFDVEPPFTPRRCLDREERSGALATLSKLCRL